MTSSAAAKRTSIGKATRCSGRPATCSTRRTASARVLARDPVLHLGELDPPLGGEDPVAAIDLGRAPGARRPPTAPAAGPAREGGEPATRERLPDPVLEHHLLRVDGRRASAGAAARRCAGSRGRAPSACAGRRRTRSGRLPALSSSRRGQGLVERSRAVDAVERERRDGADRDRVDDPERAEADPGGRPAPPDRRRPRSRASCRRRARSRPPRPAPRRCASRAPVPWVPVAIEPASVWRSMSPRFSNASPRSSRRRLSSPRTIPASTLTRPASRSTESTRSSRSQRTMTPSVSAISVNEWPEPEARTGSPRSPALRTTSASSSRVPGRSIATGEQRWSPAQLRHCAAIGPRVFVKLAPTRSSRRGGRAVECGSLESC